MAESDRRGVFVSWSQPAGAKIAALLKPFLEDVLGTVTIFASQAMEAGTRWSSEIPQRLDQCNAGLVLVTPENSQAPWLHFEAGALSKHVAESRVVPLLCAGATVGDIQGTPLSLFQAVALAQDDFLSVCLSFGAAFGTAGDLVRRRFEKNWPDLETALSKIKAGDGHKKQLDLSDLMAVLERIASQVSLIDASVRPVSLTHSSVAGYSGAGSIQGGLAALLGDPEVLNHQITYRAALAQALKDYSTGKLSNPPVDRDQNNPQGEDQ